MKHSGMFFVTAALAAVLATGSAWAQVGVASSTAGESPATPVRLLSLGADVQVHQRIATGAGERAQVMFGDGTSLTMGPKSALVVEKYEYEPQGKTGELTLSATQGAFRFVGGAIARKTDVTIRTPSAAIGLRGGIAAFAISETGATTADFLHGEAMRVSSQGTTQTATRSGSQITVPAGGSPTRPVLLRPGQLLDSATIPAATAARPAKSPSDDTLTPSDLAKYNSDFVLRQVSTQQGNVAPGQDLARTATMATTNATNTASIQQLQASIRPASIGAPAVSAANPLPTAATAPAAGAGAVVVQLLNGTLTLSGSNTHGGTTIVTGGSLR